MGRLRLLAPDPHALDQGRGTLPHGDAHGAPQPGMVLVFYSQGHGPASGGDLVPARRDGEGDRDVKNNKEKV